MGLNFSLVTYEDKNKSQKDGVHNKWRDSDANELKKCLNAILEAANDGGLVPDLEVGDVSLGDDLLVTIVDGKLNIVLPKPPESTGDLTIGTVSSGDTASATIQDGKLNLILPKGKDGNTFTLEIGTVTTGEEAAATIVDGKLNLVLPLSGGSGGAIGEDIPVILPEGRWWGTYKGGDIISGDLDMLGVIKSAVTAFIPPEYTQPSISIVSQLQLPREVGETVLVPMVVQYSAGDAGAIIKQVVTKDGVSISEAVTASITDQTVLKDVPTTYKVDIDYGEGVIKQGSDGEDYPDGHIQEGSVTSQTQIVGTYKNFYGISNVNDSTGVRGGNYSWFGSNSIVLNTGTNSNIFWVWVKAGKTITSIFDATINFELLGNFVQSSLSVADAGGTMQLGTLYKMTNAVPYSSNHILNVTIE